MAKLRGAKKAAFLRRMARGRSKSRRGIFSHRKAHRKRPTSLATLDARRKRRRLVRRRPRRLSRRKRTGYLIAGIGIATGLAAVILWPKILAAMQQPTIIVGTPTVTPAAIAALLE